MKNTLFCLFALAFYVWTGTTACTDPTAIGSELLEEDQVGTGFTDTISLFGRTVQGDTVRTFEPNAWAEALFFGEMVDPIFGKTRATIFASPSLNLNFTSLSTIHPDFSDDAVIDSVILVLPYVEDKHYGDVKSVPFSLDVYELLNGIDPTEIYYSGDSIQSSLVSLGSKTFTPTTDSVDLIVYPDGAADTLNFEHLSVRLDPSLGDRFLQADSLTYSSDSLFKDFFKGIRIGASAETKGLLAFTLSPDEDLRGGIYVYYRESDTLKKHYQFPFIYTSPSFAHYENIFKGAFIEPFVRLDAQEDSVLFVQGTQGLFARVNFPNLAGLSGKVVNKAELVAHVGSLPGDDIALYDPAEQLYMSVYNADKIRYDPVADIALSGLSAPIVFGGGLAENGAGKPKVYKFNLSTHFQDMIDGNADPVVYIFVASRRVVANRTVLYGPSHPVYPMKLNLSFSERVQ